MDNLMRQTVVPLILRLGLAAIFIFHGYEKVGAEGGTAWGPPELARPAQFAVAWGELVGGIALAIGFLTRVAAAGIGVIMAGAIITVHGPKGFRLKDGGFEYNFALLVMCAAVILLGGGTLAADRFIRLQRKKGGR